jgi:hypothetical protein
MAHLEGGAVACDGPGCTTEPMPNQDAAAEAGWKGEPVTLKSGKKVVNHLCVDCQEKALGRTPFGD